MSASYIVRVDDVCPTMNWDVWDRLERVFVDNDVRPILAVVPDNHDPDLVVAPSDPAFWDRVRSWHERGWEVAMHGFEHRYVTADGGLLRLNPRSEFAGLSMDEQRRKLDASRAAFAAQGLTPRTWVAPGHSFDATTLALLPEIGIRVVSDGHALLPFRDRFGLVWIPQQTEQFVPAPAGLWTVCVHLNRWTGARVDSFAADIESHRGALTDVDTAVARWGDRTIGMADKGVAIAMRAARSGRRRLRQFRSRSQPKSRPTRA